MVALHDTFASIVEACEAINRYVLDKGESYKVYKSNKTRHIVVCKDSACNLGIILVTAKLIV